MEEMNNQKEEEKEKKKGLLFLIEDKNKRLYKLIFALILVIAIFSVGTYAWFTSNYTVKVQQIDVTVSGGSGIQISTDAENWKSMITIDDILNHAYAGAVNQVPKETDQMNPVSTVKVAYADATAKTQGLHMYRGTIVNDAEDGTMYLDSASETDSANNFNYIAFDLFLKLDFKESEGPKQLYFTSGTGVKAGNPNTHIEYASRMGFVVNGTQPSSSDLTTLRNIKGAENVFIYEPNYDVHTSNGLANGRDNYHITGRTISGNAAPAPYYGVKAAFAYDPDDATNFPGTPLDSTDANKFALVEPDFKTTAANSSDFEFMTLPVGVTKIRVYMWIEGQDIDCENTASGGQVQYNLGFKLQEQP